MAVFRLDEEMWFPHPSLGEESGLIAVGGDLSPERLELAYSNGFFPWFSFRDWDMPLWYCPLERYVIFPREIHISHSLRTLINRKSYFCTFNEDFDGVIHNCSTVNDRIYQEGAWLGPDIISAYTTLHRLGMAKSVEVWSETPETVEGRRLVGGLYGIQLGKGFFGESMFSKVSNASKLALVFLAGYCLESGLNLIDCQFETPLFKSMGGRSIPYDEYMKLISTY